MNAIQLDERWIHIKGNLTQYWGKYPWRKKPSTTRVVEKKAD